MTTNKYTAKISIEIDLDEYPIPSDGKIKDQLKQDIYDALYELDTIKVKKIEISGRDLNE